MGRYLNFNIRRLLKLFFRDLGLLDNRLKRPYGNRFGFAVERDGYNHICVNLFIDQMTALLPRDCKPVLSQNLHQCTRG